MSSTQRRGRKMTSTTPRASAEDDDGASLALVLSPEAEEYYRDVSDDDNDALLLHAAPSDFFELLGMDLDMDAVENGGEEAHDDDASSSTSSSATSPSAVKKQFRRLQRVAHPDIAGPAAGPLAVLLNAAYATLSDEGLAEAYRASVKLARKAFTGGTQFDGRPVSQWHGDEGGELP